MSAGLVGYDVVESGSLIMSHGSKGRLPHRVGCRNSAEANPLAERELQPMLSGLQGHRRPPSGIAAGFSSASVSVWQARPSLRQRVGRLLRDFPPVEIHAMIHLIWCRLIGTTAFATPITEGGLKGFRPRVQSSERLSQICEITGIGFVCRLFLKIDGLPFRCGLRLRRASAVFEGRWL